MKRNQITVKFSDEELARIKDMAKKKDIKMATLIRTATLNSITNDELLSDKEEIKRFIIETVEEANDKKLGRIISLLFRATSHIDIVQEQNNLFYRLVHQYYDFIDGDDFYDGMSEWDHGITSKAKNILENRDKENIERHNRKNKKE